MGSLVEGPNIAIDASVGGLLWVRRRNGSWWPGQILGPDELPKASVSKSRPGTPVKLLGREDASVDWYNLEKSKRVKAFRCGEYDDCIKRAVISGSLPSKKKVNYARREDAILHALELETVRLGKDYPAPDEGGNHVHEEEIKDLNENLSNSNYSNELSHSVVSIEEIKEVEHSRSLRRTPNDSEDNATEGVKRMRGLVDLGVGVSSSSLKRKKSHDVNKSVKKRNRRRTLSKVLEYSTAVLSAPVVCEQLSTELESNESKMNNSTLNMVSMHNAGGAAPRCKQKENEISNVQDIPETGFSGMLFDVPIVVEEESSGFPTKVSCSWHSVRAQSSQCINESVSTSSATADVRNSQMIEKRTPNWQLKGKRNSRRRTDTFNGIVGANLIGRPLISDVSADSLLKPRRMAGGWKWSHTRGPSVDTVSPCTLNPNFVFSPTHHCTFGSGMRDVKVEVETNHRPQHVPCISMRSKLYGWAIVGHPISVEVLDDGSCSDLLHESYNSSFEADYRDKFGDGPTFRGKPPTRNGVSLKKTRKLSSLTGYQLQNQESKKRAVEPSIACVSLKAVFSRINGALHI